MTKTVKAIKPSKVSLFDNSKTRYTIKQVKSLTGADIVFNGSLFDMSTYKPNCDIKINGVVKSDDPYGYFGYGWKNCELPQVMHSRDMWAVDNYLSCLWVIHNGEKQSVEDNAVGIGGVRGRTAFGFKDDGTMVIICTSDTNGAMKLSQVRDRLYGEACVNGIILDGGGSSQIDTPDEDVTSARIVSNFVCVWVTPEQKKEDEKMKVCLDAGHGGNETSNGSPDGTYKEHEFTLDLANRIKLLLERCGVEVIMTRETNTTVSLTQRATIANNANADLFVSVHSNASGSAWSDASGLCVYTYAAGNTAERNIAANCLIDSMESAGIKMFGTKLYHAKFTVIANTNMPAYLVEYAFHTNKGDVELLKSDAHRDKLAIATAKAICEYGGVTWVDEPKPSNTIYRVQLGAFTDKKNAEALFTELTAKGYKPCITSEVKA